MTLDIGLPIDQLAPSIRSCLASGEEVVRVIDCTNRRGKPVRVRVNVTRFDSDSHQGVMVLVEEVAA